MRALTVACLRAMCQVLFTANFLRHFYLILFNFKLTISIGIYKFMVALCSVSV